jgi:hypothetical protein
MENAYIGIEDVIQSTLEMELINAYSVNKDSV